MCIDLGIGMLLNLIIIPIALLIINILFSRFTRWYKEPKYGALVIVMSIIMSLLWIILLGYFSIRYACMY